MIVTGQAEWSGSFTKARAPCRPRRPTPSAAPPTLRQLLKGAPGAIPEELLAAGHAGCYNHALANIARKNGLAVDFISTTAELTMGADDHGYTVDGIHLVVAAALSEITEEKFREITEGARTRCAISRALQIPITLNTNLIAAQPTSNA